MIFLGVILMPTAVLFVPIPSNMVASTITYWRQCNQPCKSIGAHQLLPMAKGETRELEPRLGKSRGRTLDVSRSHRSLVVRAAIQQGGNPTRIGKARKPSGRFNARGRGRAAAAALEGHGGWEIETDNAQSPGIRWRARRVVIKARVVKLKDAQSQAMAAHLRYLEREGVTADGQHGHAYASFGERADAKAFIARSREDRHQFRFTDGRRERLS